MEAKKMFKKLGYTLNHYESWCIEYYSKNDFWIEKVEFDLIDKSYFIKPCSLLCDDGRNLPKLPMLISLAFHQAITQQMKELGWIE